MVLTSKILSAGWANVQVHNGEGKVLCWNYFIIEYIVTHMQILMKSDYHPALEEYEFFTEVKMCSAEKIECQYSTYCRN